MLQLYPRNQIDFTWNGEPIKHTYDEHVVRNDGWYLSFKVLLDEEKEYKKLKKGMVVKGWTMDGEQAFRIWDITKGHGFLEVEALHLIYDLDTKMTNPIYVNNGALNGALTQFKNGLPSEMGPFIFSTGITKQRTYNTEDAERANDKYNAMDVFMDGAHSIVGTWEAELLVNNWDIRLVESVGNRTGALLYEKKNISEFEDVESNKNIITRIYAQSTFTPEREEESESEPQEVHLSVVVESPLINDYEQVHEAIYINNDARTNQELSQWAMRKFTYEKVDLPERTIKVSTNIIDGTEIKYGDYLVLKYLTHDVEEEIRCVGYDVNPVTKDIYEVNLGTNKLSMQGSIGGTVQDLTESQLNNEMAKVAERVTKVIMSSNGFNRIAYGPEPVPNPIEGDLWYEYQFDTPNTVTLKIWKDGMWVILLDDFMQERLKEKIEEAMTEAEQAKQDAIDKANQALEDAKAHADAEVQASKEHFDGLIADTQSDVADAQATADSAVNQIDTAVANAGFTSLNETIQNMNHTSMNAEQYAQQAITNASNAHDLAQTSISEAQTAQANSLTALGKADNALDGVSNLDIRVDDVEDELELKADNTFMTEDGELITLSNAITFNAHRFSSDMSRIESRVESLAGEINLVILRDAFENANLLGGEVYPNPSVTTNSTDTMRELIAVTPSEQFALSKNTISGDNNWRINYYTQNMEFIARLASNENEAVVTVPNNAHYMWVSYPQGSKPQIVRGTTFVPYRPNMADQMTTDEVVLFRNEYDEFADKTERRMSAIDSSGGRLEIAENLLTQTADGLTLKADQTTVDELTGDIETLGTQVDTTAGQITNRVWQTDIQGALDGVDGRNLIRRENEIKDVRIGPDGEDIANNFDNKAYYAIPVESGKTYMFSRSRSTHPSPNIRIAEYRSDDSFRQRLAFSSEIYKYEPSEAVAYIRISYPNDVDIKMEIGDRVTPYSPAPEDTATTSQISHIESSLSIEVGRIDALNTRVESNETFINDLSLTPDGFWVRTARLDRASQRIETIATLEQTVGGLQSTVADKASQSEVTQLATGVSTLVTSVSQLEEDGRNLLRRENEIKNVSIGPDGEDLASNDNNKAYYGISVEAGKTYMISRSKSERGSPNIRISEHRSDDSFRQRLVITSETYKYEPPEAVSYIRISYPNDVDIKMEVGDRVTPYSPAPEDTATTTQISQLSDNINLRVKEGDVLGQINIEAERALIQSNKLALDADSVVFTGSAFIPSAQIQSLHADKINAGTIKTARLNATEIVTQGLTANVVNSTHINADTALFDTLFSTDSATRRLAARDAWITDANIKELDAGKITTGELNASLVRVVNLDASSIAGNEANFIRAMFSGAKSTLQITSNSVNILDNAGRSSTKLSNSGIDFYRQGVHLGALEYVTNISTSGAYDNFNGVSFRPQPTSYFGVSYYAPVSEWSAYSSTTTYSKGEVVRFGSNAYISKINLNVGNSPYSGSPYWGVHTASTRAFSVSGKTGDVYVSNLIKPSERHSYGINVTWGSVTGRGTNVRIMNHNSTGGIQIDNGDLSYLTSNGWRSLNDRLS